jgi:hypothetical protein
VESCQYKAPAAWTPLCNAVAAATMTRANAGPTAVSFYLKVTISGGTTGSGTVTLTGIRTSGTTAQSETLTFAANDYQRSAYQYKAASMTGITTSGLADEATKPTVRVDACDVGGNIITSESWTNFSAFWEDAQIGFYDASGVFTFSNAVITTEQDILVGTMVRYSSTSREWQVKKSDASRDPTDSSQTRTVYV